MRADGYRCPGESNDFGEEEEIVLDAGDVDEFEEEDVAVEEETQASVGADKDDEGQAIHNEHVAKTIRKKAIQFMALKGIHLNQTKRKVHFRFSQKYVRVSFIA